ncbi:hypothetical protein SLAY_61 [Microbacterium phage Slay]|nr:hypothetical protein SLAY_61 [Microbacterium phage Slay]
MSEAQAIAEAGFAAASRDLAKQLVGKAGAANETRYGEAYQRLVQVGGAPQLKRKYTQSKKYSSNHR